MCEPQEVFSVNGKDVFTECELRETPELFNRKTVRVSSTFNFMIHGAYLSSDGCDLPQSIDESVGIALSRNDFNSLLKETLPVDMVAVGEFGVTSPSRRSDTIADRTPYHFFVSCLEKVGKEANKPSEILNVESGMRFVVRSRLKPGRTPFFLWLRSTS
jgi:hypothetical protein